MSEFGVRKSVAALAPGDRFIFAAEHGGEGQAVTVKGKRNAFGTVSVEVEEFDHELDYAGHQWVDIAPPAEDEGVGTPTPTPENTPVNQTEEIEVIISLRVPKVLGPLKRNRLIMALTTYAADMSYVIEAGVEENKGTNFTDLKFLMNEVQLAADVVNGIDNGDHLWCKFTCSEIEAVADVFRAADRHDTAVFITDQHAECDEPDDHHYKGDNDE